MKKTIFVGMSGGVDSSVAAALLKERGYDVLGIYMKNWSQDLPGLPCPWKDDYQDAKRVAVQLGIPFKVYDFENQYRQKVVDYMVREYKNGRTPNPDVMCNQEVKFGLFLNMALTEGADFIATGHYASVQNGELRIAANAEKDQTYFLYRVTQKALLKTIMPIGEYKTKAAVRAYAKKTGLITAEKKDSQGICFVGKVGIKDFLLYELGPQPRGDIIDQNGLKIGEHDGAIFYTIGQRHGLDVGGGLPYYVTGKAMDKNQVHVTTNLNDESLWHDMLRLTNLHWINKPPVTASIYRIRIRYRAQLIKIIHFNLEKSILEVKLEEPVRAITPGQSAVLYENDRVVGGGIMV